MVIKCGEDMNFQQFKHLFAKTRKPTDSELWQSKDGVLACPDCKSVGIVVSNAFDVSAHGHCPTCKFTGNLNLFMVDGLDEQYKRNGARLPVECPDCSVGSNLVVREGKYGLFVGCSNYPACKYLMNISTRVEN